MVTNSQVGTFEVLMITGYTGDGGNQIGFIYFNDTTGKYIGYAGIIREGQPLPANVLHPNGVLNFYFHEAELVPLLDTLRNEKPIFVQFNTDLKWASVGTAKEPVGRHEAPRAHKAAA
jgi:hypothetical protein